MNLRQWPSELTDRKGKVYNCEGKREKITDKEDCSVS